MTYFVFIYIFIFFHSGYPYLDALRENIERRFDYTVGIICASSIFEPKNLPKNPDHLPDYGNDKLEDLISFYGVETTVTFENITKSASADIDSAKTRVEWKAFKLVMFSEYQNSSPQEMLANLMKKPAASSIYPNIMFLIEVCLTLPVSTATVERSFSDMKQVKTRLRSRLLPESLDHLMRVAIEGPNIKDVNFDKVADIWYNLKQNRRLQWIRSCAC